MFKVMTEAPNFSATIRLRVPYFIYYNNVCCCCCDAFFFPRVIGTTNHANIAIFGVQLLLLKSPIVIIKLKREQIFISSYK